MEKKADSGDLMNNMEEGKTLVLLTFEKMRIENN